MIKRKNYLNNRDLLKEIHKSKSTYSSFVTEGDDVYDIILPNIEKSLDRRPVEFSISPHPDSPYRRVNYIVHIPKKYYWSHSCSFRRANQCKALQQRK